MDPSAVPRIARLSPSAKGASAVAALLVDERTRDMQGVMIPRPEVHLMVRFGAPARNGLDVYAMGGRQRVHRKLLRSGQRIVMARLHLGAAQAVLGVPESALAGRIVALEDLWGDATTRRLCDRCAAARDTLEAATILENEIDERLASAGSHRVRHQLVLHAADRLMTDNVSAVAVTLGMSERHLRRIFLETIGVGPKTFSKLTRFRRALLAAREVSRGSHASWARIAAAAGYYDQAHLIAEFRSISGVTPQALLGELRAAQWIG